MTEKSIANVQTETSAVNEILQTASKLLNPAMPVHLQYMVDEVHKELCNLDEDTRMKVVNGLSSTEVIKDGNYDPMGLIYSSHIYVSLDCKK